MDVAERNLDDVTPMRPKLGTRSAWAVTFPTLLLTAYYIGLAVYLSGLHAFWSPDCGARFAMIRSQIEHRRLIYVYYSAADLDPTGQIYPLAYFLFHRSHDFCVMYQPLFPFLSGLAYRAFGFHGLTVIPAFCGLGTVLVAYKTALRLELRSCLLVPPLLGLATPLMLYSVVFWDHSAQMLLAALAGYWMLRSAQDASFRNATVAGAMIGLGVWVHEMFLALFAATWLGALPFLKGRHRILCGLLLGFVPLVVLWGGFNLWVYGTPVGPHLGTNVFQNTADHPFSLALVLDQSQLAERAMSQLVGTQIADARNDTFPYYLAFFCLLLLYTHVGWSRGSLTRIAPCLCLAAAALALFLLLQGRGATGGLFLATPLLIPALSVPWYVRPAHPLACHSEVFYAWASRTCWLFALFLLINPITPGTDWGSRYLLTALPLLFLLSAHTLEQQYANSRGRWRGVAVAGAIAVVVISMLCQISGLLWVRRCLAFSQALNVQVQAISAPAVVTDIYIDGLAPDAPSSQVRFLVRTEDDASLLARIIRQRRYREVAFVGGDLGADQVEAALNHAGLPFVRHESRPLWRVNHALQEGGDLQYVRFDLKPGGEAKIVCVPPK